MRKIQSINQIFKLKILKVNLTQLKIDQTSVS